MAKFIFCLSVFLMKTHCYSHEYLYTVLVGNKDVMTPYRHLLL